MKQMTIVSGKGGTGKTSVLASLATLAKNAVIADCDVDAANLHLVLDPTRKATNDFSGGKVAQLDSEKCINCGLCSEVCRFDAVKVNGSVEIDLAFCEGCGVCAHFCPNQAIEMVPGQTGEWYVSETRFGPFVHAELGIGAENSGKLVTVVRNFARGIALAKGHDLVLVDGPPGIGCPVISAINGVDIVLAVVEPTPAGMHDMERVYDLAKHFGIPMLVAINKCDLFPEGTEKLRLWTRENDVPLVAEIPYDTSVNDAQQVGKPVIEHTDGPFSHAIRELWEQLQSYL